MFESNQALWRSFHRLALEFPDGADIRAVRELQRSYIAAKQRAIMLDIRQMLDAATLDAAVEDRTPATPTAES